MSITYPLSLQVSDSVLASDLRVLEDASDVAAAHGRWDEVDWRDALVVAVHARATAAVSA